MRNQTEYKFNSNNPFGSIIGIILMVLFLLGLFYVARFIFTILYYLSPILLVAALILDYKVVLGYVQWVVNQLKRNALLGIGIIVLSVLGFPILSLFLLGKALLNKKVKQARENAETARKGEYIEYEELDSEPLDLPPLEKKETKSQDESDSRYDEFFNER